MSARIDFRRKESLSPPFTFSFGHAFPVDPRVLSTQFRNRCFVPMQCVRRQVACPSHPIAVMGVVRFAFSDGDRASGWWSNLLNKVTQKIAGAFVRHGSAPFVWTIA